jgi:hypothetical protein
MIKPPKEFDDRPAWNEALERVEDYLKRMGVTDSLHRVRICLEILDQAKREHAAEANFAPVTLAMRALRHRMHEWFAGQLDAHDEARDRVSAAGRVALLTSDLAKQWPEKFLARQTPAELRAAMEASPVRTGPDLMLSSMTPREMDYGALEDIADETWHQFAWGPLLRASLFWTGIFFLALWFYPRMEGKLGIFIQTLRIQASRFL